MAKGIRAFHGSGTDQNKEQSKDRIVILIDRNTLHAEFENEEFLINNEQIVFSALQNIISWMQASRSVEASRKYFEELWKDMESGNHSE